VKAVFASRNRHKGRQIAELLPDVELIPLDELAPGLVLEEPFDTFQENALAKARAVVAATHLPAIADDSGLEVDALDGRPGVLSARFAGDGATDIENNRKLIAELEEVPDDKLTARYRCVAALVFADGRTITEDGSCEGHIVREGRGTEGFGYDPHFVPEGQDRTMGEIPLAEKLTFSHRGRAFRALAERMRSI
jgi:XTP/dITP diphosphohydrolase